MIVTHHLCRHESHCSNCGERIRIGQEMFTARDGGMSVNAHITCPVYHPAHLSPVIRIAGVK